MYKNMTQIIGITLAGMIALSGCASVTEMYQTPTVEATSSPTLASTSTVTVTPEATATLEATATIEAKTEIVVEGTTGIKSEFLLDGNLAINKEAGDKYYRDFIDSLARNKENKDYMVGLLGNYPDGAKLLNYLKNNDYTLPPGLNLPYMNRGGLVKLGNSPIKESIKVDTLKIVVYSFKEWNADLGGVKEYIASLKTYAGLWVADDSTSLQTFGWGIDIKDNRFVMMAGSKEAAPVVKYPQTERMTIGGADGNFDFERDTLLASAELIQINRILRLYDPKRLLYQTVGALTLLCGDQEGSYVCVPNITAFFGQGKTLFDPAK